MLNSNTTLPPNRNSYVEPDSSSLRPPSSHAAGNAQLRASADFTRYATPKARPASELFGSGPPLGLDDNQDTLAQKWIDDIDQYERTLEEMAEATVDVEFKDELKAIEQWFHVLSEAERTAALYQLLQQTTQVQIRFFIQVLQQMAKNHPVSSVLSPMNSEKDPLSNRLNEAMGSLSVEPSQNANFRNSMSAATKRMSALDPSTINAMFPDAAAAIATEKAKLSQQTGTTTTQNRPASTFVPDNIDLTQPPASPWGPTPMTTTSEATPQTATFATFNQAPGTMAPGLASPKPPVMGNSNIQTTNLTVFDKPTSTELPLFSPYNGSWASMMNTPMIPNFGAQPSGNNQAEMVANATAMKLAAMSTVNNRFALDDPRQFRKGRKGPDGQTQLPMPPASPNLNVNGNNVLINERGQVVAGGQLGAHNVPQNRTPSQGQNAFGSLANNRTRPASPGFPVQSQFASVPLASPQSNGFLSAYGINSPMMGGFPSQLGINQLGVPSSSNDGYLSDYSDARGRSPRGGRRATSRPPDDPTDIKLLEDIPGWLRSLRLHKYTDNLKDLPWKELVELDDKALEDRGVNALGARRKLLKVFDQVKEAQAEGKL